MNKVNEETRVMVKWAKPFIRHFLDKNSQNSLNYYLILVLNLF